LTASIYTSREGLDTLLLEKGLCGGLPATTDLIENNPGFPNGINGMELIDKFKEQALRFGTNILEFKEVKTIEPVGERIKVQTDEEEYNAYAVIVASGSIPKKLNIPGEEKQIEVSGVFIYIGYLPNSKFLEGIVELDDLGYIITNEKMETSIPGIYAVGDIRSKKVRQIDVACGEGTIAAISANDYLKELILI
jgi:thioredoxin reductase